MDKTNIVNVNRVYEETLKKEATAYRLRCVPKEDEHDPSQAQLRHQGQHLAQREGNSTREFRHTYCTGTPCHLTRSEKNALV